MIFDQGIGDIFNARVAGNFANDDILGSLEFACAAARAKLIVVLGHTECGAVKGACDDIVMGNLTHTPVNIKPAVAAVSGYESNRTSANDAFVKAVTNKNVVLIVERIRERSPILRDMVDKRKIGLAGAICDVHTGKVTFMWMIKRASQFLFGYDLTKISRGGCKTSDGMRPRDVVHEISPCTPYVFGIFISPEVSPVRWSID